MNILKILKSFSLKKVTAIFTTICFIFSIISSQTIYAAMPIQTGLHTQINLNNTLIPFNLGRITDAYYSNDNQDIIINIQDLHSHEQTQRNISSILSILDKNFGLSDIYIEGATETLNTQWLSNIKDSGTKEKVLNNLLSNGRLSGGELFAVQANKNTILKGLEDKNLYIENFNKLNEIYNKKLEIKTYLSILNNIFNKKAKQYYSKENKKINKKVTNYRNGIIKTNDYIEFLLKEAAKININLSKYTTLLNFVQVISKQKVINQKKLKTEIQDIIKELKEALSYDEYKSLIEKSTDKGFEIEFYFDSLKKANDLNILSKKKYPNTTLFFEYLVLNQNINTIDLEKEEKLLIKELNNKYSTTPAEKDIYFLQNNLENLSHYLTNKMTAKEHEQFLENEKEFKLLWEKYIDIDNLTDLTQYFNLVNDFYNNNLERNRIFVKKLLGKMPNKETIGLRIKNSTINHEEKIIKEIKNGRKIHIVITGGFHSYGFSKLLEEQNINYIVITPNVTEETTKAEILYENIFNEQYGITNATFANRPVTEIINILKKGAIKDVTVVDNGVKIIYESDSLEPDILTKISEQTKDSEVLNTEQAEIIADIILDIQELKKIKRENLRAQQEGLSIVSTDDLEKRIIEGFTKIEDINIKKAFGEKIRNEVWSQPLTTIGLRNTKWYQFLTKAGWINLRESLVAIFEQKDFDNIFTEEILKRINNMDVSSREKFLQEHYYGEDEDRAVQLYTELNNEVTVIINAMNNIYNIVFGYLGIHSIAQLAAKIAGAKKHKEYNVNIYKLSKNTDALLTKATQYTYQVRFNGSIRLNGIQVEYKTGDKFFTTAPTKAKALSNAVRRAAEKILNDYKLNREQLNLIMHLIYKDIGYTGFRDNLDKEIERETEKKTFKTKKEQKEYEQAELEHFYERYITGLTEYPKLTGKRIYKRTPESGEYTFNIIVPNLNNIPELYEFQKVYARSPKQAVRELVYRICMATKRGELAGGKYEGFEFSEDNISNIEQAIIKKYPNLSEIIQNKKNINNAPVLNKDTSRKQRRQMKIGEKIYRVVIPDFNDRSELKDFQYVFAVDEDSALKETVNEIFAAKKRKELKGGYYNYIAIDTNMKNKDAVLEAIKQSKTAEIEEVSEIPGEKSIERQETQSNLQSLISQLTNSKNDIELKSAIELMLKAGFKKDYIENLIYQYLTLRNGNIPQEIYSKTAPIKFGTAGVRGIMGEEVDFLDIIIITQAISNVISAIASKQNINTKDIKILVGGDSRFLSKQFAEIVSKILAANDINVIISSDDIPSPAISYYTRANKFTLSINITASHNPKEHNGYKITLGDGGQAGTDVTTMIEDEIKNIQNKLISNTDHEINIVKDSGKITPVDVKPNFIKDFKSMIRKIFAIDKTASLNTFKEKASKWTVVVDPKNGATKKYYYEILKFFGFNVVMINDTVDPTFGGQKPEPSFENTKQLREKVKAMPQKDLLGISTDVDGDRFAVVDRDGNFITANDIGTILLNFRLKSLLDNLLYEITAANGDIEKQNAILKNFIIKKDKKSGEEKDRKIIIPRNCATTHVLDDLAAKLVSQCYDKLKELNLDPQLLNKFKNNTVEVKEVNVGFKYFAQAKHNAEDNGDLFLLGVESSGGISIAEWIYDKCGFLANLMLLFVLVESNKQPRDILNDIYSQISYEPQGLETAIRFREIVEKEGKLNTPEQISAEAKSRQEQLMATLAKLKQNENNEDLKNLFINIDAGLRIKEIRANDGIKIIFENGTWLLIRPSGTEPIVRIFDETKGNKELSQKLADFVMENGGKNLTDKIEKIIETKTNPLQTNIEIIKSFILNSIKSLQRLTYSILFKDNMEYTIVANVDDLARVKQAEILSNSGIKVNLVLVGETSLIQETTSRMSTQNGELAFCLIAAPNQNLTVYGYDGNSYGQTINISTISEQDSLIAMLQHINNNSQKDIKILDLPTNLNQSIVTTDVEEKAKDLFSVVGVGKNVLNLFLDAAKMKKKKTDNMIMKPSLVASNLSSEQIDNFGQEDINRLAAQGVTTIIISANDKVLQDKSQILKNLLQTAHNNGLKVMFNYNFNLKDMSVDDLSKWISSFNDRFQLFKENGGIDGFQADLSQSGVLANNSNVLSLLSKLSKIINEQNVGSFLSIKMPSDIYPTEFLILCNNESIKLVVDYDSPLVSTAISNLKAENMIINISSDKNGFISMSQLSNIFENNKVSMLSLDLPILEAIDSSEEFSFNGLSITKFISSIFETTPEGQKTRGINKGRNFVVNRDFVIDENVLNDLYSMYISDNFNVQQISDMIKANFKENISKYELKGFIEGLLEATELKNINAADINFDKQEYSNLLMQSLLDYRIIRGISFKESDINKELDRVLVINNFSTEFQPKIDEVYKILNGKFENKVDTVINILSSLTDNPKLTVQEKTMILEGLLLLLLGYAKQDIIDIGNISQEENIANIKAILRAA